MKYGLIMSAITAFCLIMMQITGQNDSFDNKSPFQFFFMFVAPAIVWYFGIKAKKKANKGKLTFKQGLVEGFKISLVYGLVSPFVFLAFYLINPAIIDYIRKSYNMMTQSTLVVITVDMVAQFVASVVFGVIYASVISLLIRTKGKSKK